MPPTASQRPRPTDAPDPAVGVAGATATGESAPATLDRRAAPAAAGGGTGRWWLAVGVGIVGILPLAWLLSYAATLPFFLGLFFFVLFGLLIGAVMHRIASPSRPYRTPPLVVGTTIVLLLGWCLAIVNESRDFPENTAFIAGKQTRYIGDRTIEEYRTAVAADIRRFLSEQYPPGGPLGYVRWVITSGELKKGQIEGLVATQRPRQAGASWVIRAVLSVALLAFGIGSQTLALAKTRDPSIRAIDNEPEQPPS